jgi:hypothetical protein
MAVDSFGITQLKPTISGGTVWEASWNTSRSFTGQDPNDTWFDADHGSASYSVSGGVLSAGGSTIRMYIHDPALVKQWRDTEMTVYFKRVSDSSPAYAGLTGIARSNHGTIGSETSNLCDTRGVGARMRIDGHIDFEKEIRHPNSTAVANKTYWSGGLPTGQWIGYKYLCYDLPTGDVKLELYIDTTDGTNGGTWTLINEFTDTGSNMGSGTACATGISPSMRLTNAPTRSGSETGKPNITCYFRTDNVNTNGIQYKRMSVREIDVSGTVVTPPPPAAVKVIADDFNVGGVVVVPVIKTLADDFNVSSAVVAPSAPLSFLGTPLNGGADLDWIQPDTGDVVTSYTIRASGLNVPIRRYTVPTAGSWELSGLVNGVIYTFELTAQSASGPSPTVTTTVAPTGSAASPSAGAVLPAPIAPDAPTLTTATSGDGGATIAWTAPSYDGGGAITNYTVVAVGPTTVERTVGNVLTTTLAPMTNGSAYNVTVVATNGVGSSVPSNTLSVTPASGGVVIEPPPVVIPPVSPVEAPMVEAFPATFPLKPSNWLLSAEEAAANG